MLRRKSKKNLIVTAHPDDESIFFAGLVLSSKQKFDVICVTDGDADGVGSVRQRQFRQACSLLGIVKADRWDYPDQFNRRLNVQKIKKQLCQLPRYDKIYTHGILGEYGHRHHQDVSYAVHTAFYNVCPVYSVAYNIMPDQLITLKEPEYRLKTKILWQIYSSEIRRFLNFLPATHSEGFTEVAMEEVETIYQWLTKKKPINTKVVNHYRWLVPYLKMGAGTLLVRPF